VKKFRVGAATYYLMGLHENATRLWQTVSTNGLAFPAARPLLTNLTAADSFIVALGWVTRVPRNRQPQAARGSLRCRPVSALNQNSLYARWLQKRVVFAANDGTRFVGTKAIGPERQLLAFPTSGPVTGRFEVYAEDGLTPLGASTLQTVSGGQTFRLQ